MNGQGLIAIALFVVGMCFLGNGVRLFWRDPESEDSAQCIGAGGLLIVCALAFSMYLGRLG